MKKTVDYTSSGVKFTKVRNGYAVEQVDRYIEMLGAAYQSLSEQYNELLCEYEKIKEQSELSNSKAQVLTKTLVDAELMAQQIIENAGVEAEKIIGDAYIEKIAAKRSIAAANEAVQSTIANLQKLVM